MKRLIVGLVVCALALGTIAILLPTPTVEARECVFCPQIAIECGECYNLMPQTCQRCAFCKRIPGCQP